MAIKKEPTSTGMSPMEELRQLEKRRDELRAQVKDAAEAHLREALDAYNGLDLGKRYELREAGLPRVVRNLTARSEGSQKGTRQANPERPCPLCGFRTNPPHDARAHRSQTTKAPFTAEELSARGMQKVS